MKVIFNDGGRAAAGFKGRAEDCVVRAIAIATETPYKTVYDCIELATFCERKSKRRRSKSSPESGVYKPTYERVIRALGFVWTPCMGIGTGCRVHLRDGELPTQGRLIVRCSKHLTAVIDGVIHDTYNPTRNGTRCVYGYWSKG